jgi:hypothetical protein
MRVAGHERVGAEPSVLRGVGNHEQIALEEGVLADRNVEGQFAHPEADLRLEPLAPVLDQVHHGQGGVAHMGGDAHEIVEGRLRRGIENPERAQSGEPLRFVPRWHRGGRGRAQCLRSVGAGPMPERRLGALTSGNMRRAGGAVAALG